MSLSNSRRRATRGLLLGVQKPYKNARGQVAKILLHSSDDRVVRASVSVAVDLSLIPGRVKPMTLKLVFIASLLDAQYKKGGVKKNPASSHVVPLVRARDFPILVW